MDDRIKKNTRDGRESRAADDASRAAPEQQFVSAQERRRMFRNEWIQESLPTPRLFRDFILVGFQQLMGTTLSISACAWVTNR